ncbi:MAG: F0F1 ATP synthase subunit A [Pseudomonadota bacterium]|nr:F0F1 ATP synthase subunit A [Pseudomonadota bacterium]
MNHASPLAGSVLLQVGPVPLSGAVVTTWGVMAVLALLTASTRLDRHGRPSRRQALLELLVSAVDQQIRDIMQVEPAPYRSLIGSLFLLVLCCNWSGLVPGVEPPTARLETDAALALLVAAVTVLQGVRQQGLIGYLASFARPSWLMVPLNLVEQVTRTFSMTVRLFGNVMSGAFVIGIVLSLAGLLVPVPLMALDLLTGTVQAYIFAVLSMVCIGSALPEVAATDADPAKPQQGANRALQRKPPEE